MYKVLLVEDDSAMRYLYKKMKVWSEFGFMIADEAANGREALEFIRKNKYDLVFSDIRMPFIDGIELLRRMKNENMNTIVVYSSSYNEFEYARQGLILGAFDYILKPVKADQLKSVLERVYNKILIESDASYLDPVIEDIFIRLDIEPSSGKFIYQCAEFFSENYKSFFSMEDMADALNYNKDYFGKLFKQNFGISFNNFMNYIRISYAGELLWTGNYKIYEISEMLGYSSVDYFTKIFREITGVTPSAYKLQNHSN